MDRACVLGQGVHLICLPVPLVDDAAVEAAQKHEWIHYEGSKFGKEKIPYLMLSKLMLMPGLVGLCVIDCFASETPLITTEVPFHSPEIFYLVDGVNGIVVKEANDTMAYASKVVKILQNDFLLDKLKMGCRVAKDKYSMERMILVDFSVLSIVIKHGTSSGSNDNFA